MTAPDIECRSSRGEVGATMVEYSIMVALICFVSLVIVGSLGLATLALFDIPWS